MFGISRGRTRRSLEKKMQVSSSMVYFRQLQPRWGFKGSKTYSVTAVLKTTVKSNPQQRYLQWRISTSVKCCKFVGSCHCFFLGNDDSEGDEKDDRKQLPGRVIGEHPTPNEEGQELHGYWSSSYPWGENKVLEDYGCSFLRSFCLRVRGRALDLRNLSPKKADDLNLEETWKKTEALRLYNLCRLPPKSPAWVREFQGRLVSVGRRRAWPSSRAVEVGSKHKERVGRFPKLSS